DHEKALEDLKNKEKNRPLTPEEKKKRDYHRKKIQYIKAKLNDQSNALTQSNIEYQNLRKAFVAEGLQASSTFIKFEQNQVPKIFYRIVMVQNGSTYGTPDNVFNQGMPTAFLR